MRRLIVVFGAGGQLGESMVSHLSAQHEVVARDRRDVDITQLDAVYNTLRPLSPEVVINCAAYTNVDGAENDPVSAFAVNAMAVRTLARAAGEVDATFVHFSTDFVFDGRATQPYTEADAPNPRGTYGASKLTGEFFAVDCPRHYILRVESLFGGRHARSSVDKIAANIRSGAEVRAFSDRTVSPTFVDDAVMATAELLERSSPPGVYHCVNSGMAKWTDLAREVGRILDRPDARIIGIPMAEARLLAPRPLFAALSNAKLAAQGIAMPTWQDALARYLKSTV